MAGSPRWEGSRSELVRRRGRDTKLTRALADELLAAPPDAAPTAAAADEADDEKQHDAADRRVDDRADNSDAEMDVELRQQPVADEGADDSDDNVANQPKTGPAHDVTGQPSRDKTDDEDDEEAFVGQVHGNFLRGETVISLERLPAHRKIAGRRPWCADKTSPGRLVEIYRRASGGASAATGFPCSLEG